MHNRVIVITCTIQVLQIETTAQRGTNMCLALAGTRRAAQNTVSGILVSFFTNSYNYARLRSGAMLYRPGIRHQACPSTPPASASVLYPLVLLLPAEPQYGIISEQAPSVQIPPFPPYSSNVSSVTCFPGLFDSLLLQYITPSCLDELNPWNMVQPR
jgi:hypothetical protein